MESELSLGRHGTFFEWEKVPIITIRLTLEITGLIYARRFSLDRKTKKILAPIPEIIGQ